MNVLLILSKVPYMWKVSYLLLCSRFSFYPWLLAVWLLYVLVGIPTCCSLSFMDIYIYVFHQIWDVLAHYFFEYFFYSFLLLFCDSHNAYIVLHLMSHKSLRLCSLFFHLFPFCSSDSITSIVLSVHWFFLLPVQMSLNPSSEFIFMFKLL